MQKIISSQRNALLVLLLAQGLALTTPAAGPSAEREPPRAEPKAGEVVNFSLLDYNGKHYELRRAESRVVVLYFTSFGCPIARQSVPKLRALRNQFDAKTLTLWLVNSSPQDDPDDSVLKGLVRGVGRGLVPPAALADPEVLRSEILKATVGRIPILRDEMQLVARQFNVTRTCEVIAIDTKNSTIIYRGALDDQFSEGAQKPKPTQQYLATALEEFLAGKPVNTPSTQVHGCRIAFEIEPAAKPISYGEQIAPMLQKHCVACHSPGNIGPWAMSSYKKIKGWSAMIQEVVLDRRMPPWHADPHYGKFVNDRSLTAVEAHTLLDWVRQGCPRGEGPDPLTNAAPPAVTWNLGQPDFVVSLPKPEEIPATGTLNYRYIDADFELPQDAWFRAAVCRPGNARVVHHIIVRVKYPEDYKDVPAEAFLFTSWVPGFELAELPADTGVFLPKGSRFNFELHYTTNGEEQTDQSQLGLYLAKEPAQRRLEVRASETRDFEIAPGDPDAQHYTLYCFKRDTMLYSLSPHMHFRGSWFKYQLLHLDGRRETLLSVPHYDFNWQTSYALAEPRRIPAGTWLLCTGAHDNSVSNPNNPDPAKLVRWGLQSWDEMFMGFMTVADAPTESVVKQASK